MISPAPIRVTEAVIVGDCSGSAPGAGAVSSALARPKSRTFTVPSSRTFTLAGFRSRWITPASCAACSARAICRAMDSTSSRGIGPCSRRSARVGPSTSSRTSARVPPASSRPWIWAMLGWFSEARTRASRSKRASRSGSAVNASGSTFSATSRSSFVSRARYTSPMPPAPSGPVTL